jgi:hypothetical protein
VTATPIRDSRWFCQPLRGDTRCNRRRTHESLPGQDGRIEGRQRRAALFRLRYAVDRDARRRCVAIAAAREPIGNPANCDISHSIPVNASSGQSCGCLAVGCAPATREREKSNLTQGLAFSCAQPLGGVGRSHSFVPQASPFEQEIGHQTAKM